ncbi:hypothetical protein COCNU_11G011730 [Cocos nucifera]|uniref:Uncharacterized protein n=1 Tax=Cocos nucifera TaxID=13894 RepID=A0A8K0IPY9_COCNU|nr:hypothetical protein COCNU_11G011730 [Cocos nucifera]
MVSLKIVDEAELHAASLDTAELHSASLQNLLWGYFFLRHPNSLDDELGVEVDFALATGFHSASYELLVGGFGDDILEMGEFGLT